MNGTPALSGKLSTASCVLALVKLRKNIATGTVFFGFITRFPLQQSLRFSRRIGTQLVLDVYTFFSLKCSLLPFLAWLTQWQHNHSYGQDGGGGTYFLVLIKARLWGLHFFNISSYQCFVVWCTAGDLALMLAVCEILGNVDWCVDKALFKRNDPFFYYKVVS